jgi:acetylglutamate kinase
LRILIKIGGTLVDSDSSRRRLAHEVSQIVLEGHRVVLVHGGGKQMTKFLNERGVESRFVDGLRVTTSETLDAVLKVFAGSVNKQLVAALIETGAEAVGLSGIDAGLVEAELLRPELGAVGRPVRCNGALLDLLTGSGYLPVIACVAGDRQGHIYNVNADQMAVACAVGFKAERLFFLTDVDGVLDGEKRLMRSISLNEIGKLIEEGIVTGGMQAKLNSAGDALRQDVQEVIVAPGNVEQGIQRLLAGEKLGTRLVQEEVRG